MEKDVPILKNKWIEVYFGLFGPYLTYHTNGYDDDNARFVISLFLLKLYITLPWKTRNKKKYDFYGVYGFYTASEPDRIIFCWDEKVRYFCMPWVFKVKESKYLGEESRLVDQPFAREHEHKFHGTITYWIERNTVRRAIWGKINWFDKYEFIVYTNLHQKHTNEMFHFKTKSNICIPEQIDLQLLMCEYENF